MIWTTLRNKKYGFLGVFVFCGLGILAAPSALGQNQNQKPKLLRDVGIDQNLNKQIPLQLTFRDETGKTVQLQDYFGQKPVILALVYYECPMLCTQVLNGLLTSLKGMPLDVGK